MTRELLHPKRLTAEHDRRLQDVHRFDRMWLEARLAEEPIEVEPPIDTGDLRRELADGLTHEVAGVVGSGEMIHQHEPASGPAHPHHLVGHPHRILDYVDDVGSVDGIE